MLDVHGKNDSKAGFYYDFKIVVGLLVESIKTGRQRAWKIDLKG